MLQRIQTLFLLAVIGAVITMGILPVAHLVDAGGLQYSWTGFSWQVPEGGLSTPTALLWPGWVGIGAIIALVAITISQFKNRPLQIRLARLSMLLTLLLWVWFFLHADALASGLNPAEPVANYGVSAILPLIALILLFLAARAIRKDDELVRSVDRLR